MQVILRTMKKYGMIISDNGSNWYFQGTHDDRWNDEEISTLKGLHGKDFEAVDISPWKSRPGFDPNSGKVPGVSGVTVSMLKNSHYSRNFICFQNFSKTSNRALFILFHLKTNGFTSMKVYDALGKEVRTVFENFEKAGTHTVYWDGKNSSGYYLGKGVYLFHLESGDGVASTKKYIQ